MPTIHIIIKGIVQGVFYRATAKKVADKLQLSGWIKNTAEGNVETVVTGTREQLNEFIAWCREGPDKARVTGVAVTEEMETAFKDFEIIRGR